MKDNNIRFRATPIFKKQVKEAASFLNITMTQLITESLRHYLNTILPQIYKFENHLSQTRYFDKK